MVFVATTQLSCTFIVVIDKMETEGYGWVLIKLYLQTKAVSSLPSPDLECDWEPSVKPQIFIAAGVSVPDKR